ncbi:hypothetical protein N0V83_001520 [Neocucurbitaria cava]|uniref:Heterokaryon incompatibility domain-containing protein n=1 Tax=Neocucurbitaria cava TaxID=798079 RepID=A0A9W9CQG7_9PLEO|nr:hypothetical protein N0V83_001520 [Neocucurbitaria cava]
MTYEYKPISTSAGAIRVLVLQPAPHIDAPIEGYLEHITYTSFPYIAISYVWGSATKSHHLAIDGHSFGVGQNLYNVLRSVRDKSKPLSLWIDAICINQNDMQERGQQVQDMALIYRNAEQVVGWLGDKTPDFDAGFSLLKLLIENDSEAYLKDTAFETSWEALTSLLDRPYWTRVWILQETAINTKVHLRFGINPNDELTVGDLEDFDNMRFEVVSKWRELHPENEWEGSSMQRFDVVMNNVYNMGYLPKLCPLTADEFQPLLQSHMCNGPLATNALDYVYGVLGLFDSAIVSVDYSISARELYLKVLETVQHRAQQLDFLSWAWGGYAVDSTSAFGNPFGLPRWGMDFSYRTRFVRPIPLANASRPQRLIWDTFYRSSGDSRQILKFDMANNLFVARGVEVAILDLIGTIANTKESFTIWPEDWSSIAGLGNLASPGKQFDSRSDGQDLALWSLSSEKVTFSQLNIWWRTLFGDTLSREARIDSSEEDKASIPPKDRDGVENLCKHLTEYLQIQVHDGRRMFKTRHGRLGLAPPGAESGDVVCVLFGGDVPYVLRRMGMDNWLFVGECYLHDMMDGQALSASGCETTFTIYG